MGAFHPESMAPLEKAVPLCPHCHERRVDSMDHEGFCSERCFFAVYPHGVGEKTSGEGLSLQNEKALDRFETDVKALEADSGLSWEGLKVYFKTDNIAVARARWDELNGSRSNVVDINVARKKRKNSSKPGRGVSREDGYKEAA